MLQSLLVQGDRSQRNYARWKVRGDQFQGGTVESVTGHTCMICVQTLTKVNQAQSVRINFVKHAHPGERFVSPGQTAKQLTVVILLSNVF